MAVAQVRQIFPITELEEMVAQVVVELLTKLEVQELQIKVMTEEILLVEIMVLEVAVLVLLVQMVQALVELVEQEFHLR
jgi:hypothetical protein